MTFPVYDIMRFFQATPPSPPGLPVSIVAGPYIRVDSLADATASFTLQNDIPHQFITQQPQGLSQLLHNTHIYLPTNYINHNVVPRTLRPAAPPDCSHADCDSCLYGLGDEAEGAG